MPKRKSALKTTILFGLMTGALYGVIFSYSDLVMKYFTKGGVYALLPVLTAFVVSFVHGTFAGTFWSALGIEASQSVVKRIQPEKRKRVTKRPRLYLTV